MKAIWNFVYLYLGVGHIHHMIRKPKDYEGQKPSNIMLWIITVYTGLFTLAFQRYENKVNRLYSSFSAYSEQLGPEIDAATLQGFIDLQSREVPVEANYWHFHTPILTFFVTEPFNDIVKDVGDMAPRYIQSSGLREVNGLKTSKEVTFNSLKSKYSIWFRNSEIDRIRILNSHDTDIELDHSFIRELKLERVTSLYLDNEYNDELDSLKVSRAVIDICSGEIHLDAKSFDIHESVLSNDLEGNDVFMVNTLNILSHIEVDSITFGENTFFYKSNLIIEMRDTVFEDDSDIQKLLSKKNVDYGPFFYESKINGLSVENSLDSLEFFKKARHVFNYLVDVGYIDDTTKYNLFRYMDSRINSEYY